MNLKKTKKQLFVFTVIAYRATRSCLGLFMTCRCMSEVGRNKLAARYARSLTICIPHIGRITGVSAWGFRAEKYVSKKVMIPDYSTTVTAWLRDDISCVPEVTMQVVVRHGHSQILPVLLGAQVARRRSKPARKIVVVSVALSGSPRGYNDLDISGKIQQQSWFVPQ